MTRKARSHDVLGKLSAFSMAVILLLSVFVPMFASTVEAGAASNSYNGALYVDFSLNSQWKEYANTAKSDPNTVITFGGQTLTQVSGDLYKTASASFNNSVGLEYSHKIADPVSGYSRIYLNSSNYGTTPCLYYWSDSDTSMITWPGVNMTNIKDNLYFADYKTGATKVIFSNKGDSNTQSSNLTIESGKPVYNGSGWTTLDTSMTHAKETGGSINLGDRYNNLNNKVYVLADGSLKWSKYNDDVTSQTYSGNTVTVKLYAPGWTKHQVVFDVDEPNPAQWKTADMTAASATASNGQTVNYYEVQVPVGSAFYFQPNTNLKTDNLTVPADNDNLYYNVEKKAWVTIDSLVVIADYTVPSNWGDQSNIVGVKATYFDYLSDNEINNNQWLNTPSNGEWFQFGKFNEYISDKAGSNPSWMYPLYFGNLYKDGDESKNDGYNSVVKDLIRYSDATNALYAINNSNGMARDGGNYYQSLMGLAYPMLDANGDIQAAAGVKMPYFDAAALQGSNVAKVVDSYFPFKATTDANTGVTTYSFNSTNATDNVYFAWDNDVPKYVNYGAGTDYGVNDAGGSYGGTNGYGIFPFNSKVTSMPKLDSDTSGDEGGSETVTDGNTQIVWAAQQSSNKCYIVAVPKFVTEIDINNGRAQDQGGTETKFKLSGYNFDGRNVVFKTGGDTFESTSYPTINGISGGSFADDNYYYIVIEDNQSWGNVYLHYYNDSGVQTSMPGIQLVDGATGEGYPTHYTVKTSLSGSTGNSYTRYNNSNLDFGFGIRLDIDFRVPAYGTVNGTENGTPVTFDYSGDDDLWVYISDDSGNSNLVLDLGGDHKQAQGSINFHTMSATAKDVYADYSTDSPQVLKKSVTTYFNDSTETTAKYLDPNKTYHMTVFYMERGQAESNFKVEFTMTVPSHDLTVDKTVNVDNVNSGLKSAVQSNDTFGFTSTQGETVKNSSLGNGGQVTYDKVFTVGESMNVAESTTDAKLSYSTKHTVYDKVSGDTIVSGNGLSTADFDYINTKNDKNEQTSLQAHYENTVLASPLKIVKDLVDKDNNPINNSEATFNFKIGFDLSNSGEYTNYNLNYKLYNDDGTDVVNPLTGINSYTATAGEFSITSQQYAVFEGVPQGAKYRINETNLAPGYSVYKINNQEYSNPEYDGTVADTQSDVTFVNKFVPVTSSLQAFKYLDNNPYNETDFTFTQTLLYCDNNEVGADTYSNYNDTQSKVSSGKVTFRNITYGKTGFYYYSITEGLSDGVASDKYVMDSTRTYYAQVQVTTDTNGQLTVIKKYYGNYDSANHTVSNEIDGVPTFYNTTATKYTDVSFVKQDENGNPLSGAEFTLYTDSTCTTQATENNASKAGSGFTNPVTSAESTGLVTFKQLKYEPSAAGNVMATYYFKETKAPNGYQLLTGTFKIEIATDGNYKIYYDNRELSKNADNTSYVVTNIKQPELPLAGGVGVTMFYVLGALAVVIAGTAFVLYKKRINVIALAAHLIHRK